MWSDEEREHDKHVRGSVKVAPVTKRSTEKRPQWNTRVTWRREEGQVVRMADEPIQGMKTENQVERLV